MKSLGCCGSSSFLCFSMISSKNAPNIILFHVNVTNVSIFCLYQWSLQRTHLFQRRPPYSFADTVGIFSQGPNRNFHTLFQMFQKKIILKIFFQGPNRNCHNLFEILLEKCLSFLFLFFIPTVSLVSPDRFGNIFATCTMFIQHAIHDDSFNTIIVNNKSTSKGMKSVLNPISKLSLKFKKITKIKIKYHILFIPPTFTFSHHRSKIPNLSSSLND